MVKKINQYLNASVTDNAALHRFEMHFDGGIAFVDYRRQPGVVALLHAFVPPEFEGRGVGSALAQGVLEAIRASGDKVIPRCSFIAAYIARHPEFQSLVAAEMK
jgi:uncharacterized protein